MNTIKLRRQLNVFAEADTHSELLGSLDKGSYELSEFKQNYPNDETDYASVFDPDKNRNVWVCTRFRDTDYASRNNATVYDFETDAFAIDEKQLTGILPKFTEFTYDLHKPTYPFELRGCELPIAPPKPAQNNCCTFVEGLLVKAWENAISDFSWDNKKHGQMMIFSAEDYYSPITCLVEQNMALEIEGSDSEPQRWTVVQGWRDQWKGGHTFIILDYHAETDRVLTLESNAAYGLNGVGYRKIGNYADHLHPSSTWWQNESLWTWEKFKSAYKYRKLAKLKVKNVDWV